MRVRLAWMIWLVAVMTSIGFWGCLNGSSDRSDAGLEDADGPVDGLGGDDGGAVDDDGGPGADDGDQPGDGADQAGDPGGDDAGGDGDGGPDRVELLVDQPVGWQRGPVRLSFSISGPDQATADVSVAYSTDGQQFRPSTALPNTMHEFQGLPLSPSGVGGRFVWDSKKNLQRDEPGVILRVTARVDGSIATTAETDPFDLHNALDTDRPIVVAHPYDTDPMGDSEPGTRASLAWLRADGSLEFDGHELPCGAAPELVRFTADGRFGVVLGDGEGGNQHSLAPFRVARDGTITRLGGVIDLAGLGLSGADLVPALDGSGIWLVHYTGEGGLFFLSFEDGNPALATGIQGNHLLMDITLPTAMAALPDNRRAILSGGALIIDDPPYDVTLVDLQTLTILDQAVIGFSSLSDRVAVSSDGGFALMPSDDWFGGPSLLWAVDIDGDSIGSASFVEVSAPARVYLHPSDTAALLTSWDSDSVTVLDASVLPPRVTQTIAPVYMADHVACVSEGSLSGLCLVSSTSLITGISALVPIHLAADATAVRGWDLEFGDGYDSITSGVDIQP